MEGEVTSLGIRRLEFKTWLSPCAGGCAWDIWGPCGSGQTLSPSSPCPSLCLDLLHWLLYEPGPLFWPRSGHEAFQPCTLGESGPPLGPWQ